MNPYTILGIIVLVLGIGAGGYAKGRKDAEMDALVIQQAANKAAVEALVSIREELRPKVYSYHQEVTKYPDCHATKEGHNSLLELYK